MRNFEELVSKSNRIIEPYYSDLIKNAVKTNKITAQEGIKIYENASYKEHYTNEIGEYVDGVEDYIKNNI